MTVVAGLRSGTLGELVDKFGGRAVALAFSKDPNAKVTILLFGPGSARPELVAKVPTTAVAAISVERESATLRRLGSRPMGRVGDTIPRVVETVEHSDFPVMVTGALPGTAMLIRYHAWRHTARPAAVATDFDAAATWLSSFQEATAGADDDLANLLDGVSAALSRRFDGHNGLACDLDDLASLQSRLSGLRMPRTVVHGDFWLGNLLVEGGSVSGVVDWELARDAALPAHDLARFAVAYSLYLDRHTRPGRRVAGHPGLRADRWGAGLDYAIDGTGWYPELVRHFLTEGLSRLGVDPRLWRDVVLAELAVLAAEVDHLEFARDHLAVFRRLCRVDTP